MLDNKILIKISGESFSDEKTNFNINYINNLVDQIILLKKQNKKIIIVLGGGNICRGNQFKKYYPNNFEIIEPFDRVGMMATAINGIILKTFFKIRGITANLLNSNLNFSIKDCKKYSKEQAIKELNENKILILISGKGIPNYSTDILITEKAEELNVLLILLGKNKVNGIYEEDPLINIKSKFLKETTFEQIYKKKLRIIDLEAAKLGIKIKNLEMIVFNIKNKNSIINAFNRKGEFTYVNNKRFKNS